MSAGADAVVPQAVEDSSYQAMTRRRYMRPRSFSMAAKTRPLMALEVCGFHPGGRRSKELRAKIVEREPQ